MEEKRELVALLWELWRCGLGLDLVVGIPICLKRWVKNMRIRRRTMELFIRPSEMPKEICREVIVCFVVRAICVIS